MKTSDLLELSDNELVSFIVKTEAGTRLWNKAHDLLHLRNSRKLVSIVMQQVRNQANAEVIAQEAFKKAFFSLSGFKGESTFFSWLYRIARHILIDGVRAGKYETSVTVPIEGDNGVTVADPVGTPVAIISDNEELKLLQLAIQQLKSKDQELINLRIKEITFREIGEMMNTNPTTLRTRYMLLLPRLRDIMNKLRRGTLPRKRKGLLARIFGSDK